MEKRLIVLVAISFMCLVIILFTVGTYLRQTPLFNPSTSECKSFSYNGEGKINLVFFATKENVEKYSDALLNTKPLNENKDKFNIYYIDDYSPECSLYKEIALLCQNRNLLRQASACPNDYIVALKEKESKIRSSSYMNVLSINTNHPKTVLPHEFGHAFANLAEEYTPAKIPSKSENCQKDCEQFKECFPGCSQSDYFRSINSGIMKTLYSSTYGEFNEDIISERIGKETQSTITGRAIYSEECEKDFILLELKYDSQSNTIEVINKSKENGCLGHNGNGPFDFSLISSSGEIARGDFNPELIYTDSQTQKEEQINGETFVSKENFFLRIPSIDKPEYLTIKKDDVKIAKINLQDLDARPCKQ